MGAAFHRRQLTSRRLAQVVSFVLAFGVAICAGPTVRAMGAGQRAANSTASVSTPGCNSQFHLVAAGPGSGTVNSMAVVSATDIWAVGTASTSSGNGGPHVEHWDGSTWSSVVFGSSAFLTSVTAVKGDSTSVWAVGSFAGATAMAAHWTGSGWSVITLGVGELFAVTAVSANNIWAVGTTGGPSPLALIEHYDGTTWSSVSGTNLPSSLGSLSAASASDIWAVGGSSGRLRTGSTIAHFDGVAWSGVASSLASDSLTSVTDYSSTSAWAVGGRSLYPGVGSQALIEHWDGKSWLVVPSPPVMGALTAITAQSPTNAWAAGYTSEPQSSNTKTLVEHWDGSNWNLVPSPNADIGPAYFDHSNYLWSVVATSATNVMVGGGYGSFDEQALIENFCVPAPAVLGITPLSGNETGGIQVTISGSDFTYASSVCFGPTAATSFTIVSDFQIVATAPPGTAGAVDITVTNATGTSGTSSADVFVYVPPAVSWQQYRLDVSDGVTWQPIDPNVLVVGFTPQADSNAIIGGNADLWTTAAGVNQDLGIVVSGGAYGSGKLMAWKESGGAGTFSPNAAFVESVVPMKAGIPYTASLVWKANHATAATIFVGAGATAPFSPTRLTLQLVGASDVNLQTVVSTQQYILTGSDGTSWTAMDSGALTIPFTPSVGGSAVLEANVDLWTQSLGLNQDVGISVSGGFLTDQLVAWKESGGVGATFSPNAAYAQGSVWLMPATPYTITLKWKANHAGSGTIRAGAGVGPQFSPTRLTLHFIPGTGNQADISKIQAISTVDQLVRPGTSGTDWTAMPMPLQLFITPASNALYILSGNADLWTNAAGVNQDMAITIRGGAYGSGVVIAWKESGGFAGTFSPNAAFVQTVVPLTAGIQYVVRLAWKPNKASTGNIYAGAGSAYPFSPTWLVAQVTN